MTDDVRGPWAMRLLLVLWMAGFLTSMESAVKFAIACIGTFEHARPPINDVVSLRSENSLVTGQFVASVTARCRLFGLAAIAASVDGYLARAAEPLVAFFRTLVLSARHQFATGLSTAPTMFIIRVSATASCGVSTTIATLSGPHLSTRRARTGVA